MVSNSPGILQQYLRWGRQATDRPAQPVTPTPQAEPVAEGPDRVTLSSEARQQLTAELPPSATDSKPAATVPPAAPPRKGSLINLKA